MAIKKLALTTPPSRFFQGISTDYTDNITYVEFLLGIMKKINEIIVDVNKANDFITEYSGKIEEIEGELNQIRSDINEQYDTITAETDEKLVELMGRVQGLLYECLAESKAYTNTQFNNLQNQIDNIVLGEINVYDPTSGAYVPLQIALNNIYDATRENALTATEYDGLELTATTYDGYQITAFDYDNNGKEILMA